MRKFVVKDYNEYYEEIAYYERVLNSTSACIYIGERNLKVMNLSLTFLAEKLSKQYPEYYLHVVYEQKYEEILVEKEAEFRKEMKPSIVLCSTIPIVRNEMDNLGFLCVLKKDVWDNYDKNMIPEELNILYIITNQMPEDILSSVWKCFYDFQKLELQISQCITKKDGLQKICQIISSYVNNAVYIVDDSFKVLALQGDENMRQMSAVWKALEDVGYVPYSVISNLISSHELANMESSDLATLQISQYFYTPFINYNIRINGSIQGHFFVIGMQKTISDSDVELVDMLGKYICQAMIHNPEFVPTRGIGYEHFIMDVMQGKMTDQKMIEERIQNLGLKKNGEYAVCIVDMLDTHELNYGYIAREIEQTMHLKPVIQGNRIFHIVNLECISYVEAVKKFKKLTYTFHCRISLSEEFIGFHNINTYYNQSQMLLALCTDDDPFLSFSNQYLLLLAHELEKNQILDAFICKEAKKMKKYDSEKSCFMEDTFLEYFFCGQNIVHTAQKLHIHRNTLMYRLEKVSDIAGLDFDDKKQMMRTWISLLLSKKQNL